MPTPLRFDEGTLVLDGMPEGEIRRAFPQAPWTHDPRTSSWRCDAMAYHQVREAIDAGGLTVADEVPAWEEIPWPAVDLPALRPEQEDAKAAWMRSRRGVVVMPTGTGKTEVALSIMRETAASTLVVSPVRDLMYQWHRRILRALGYDAGIIGDNLFDVRPVSVTTYDSACIHMNRLGAQFRFLVFDECHHLPGEIRRDAARMSAAPWRLGLTATPERSDGRNADFPSLIGPVVYELLLSAVRGKTLADYDVVRIPVHLTEPEQDRYDSLSRTVRGYMLERRKEDPKFSWQDLCAEAGSDPDAREAQKAYYVRKSIEDRADEKMRVLEDLFRLHRGEPVVVFAGSNAMARDVSMRFLVPCLLNHCGKKERLEILEGIQDGAYPALVANQVLDEGVDLPTVKVAVVIGGMASTKQAKQRLGRLLRRSGERKATLYEVVCTDTGEEERSRKRRRSDAFQRTRHRRV